MSNKRILLFVLLQLLPLVTLAQTFTRIETGAIVNDGGGSVSAAWGDYDNDGYLDLFVSNQGGNPVWAQEINFLYRNNGDGTFERIETGEISGDIGTSLGSSWGDYNNDGYLDLFVANADEENNFLYRNEGDVSGDGQFILKKITVGAIANDGETSVFGSWADYNNDGNLDLFLTNPHEKNFLYRNNGNGTFDTVDVKIVDDGDASFGASWADYDNDGDLDLFVANGFFVEGQKNYLYQNNGDETFTEIGNDEFVNDLASSINGSWGDYDNDGDLDLFVANTGNNSLYNNNGKSQNFSFTKVTIGDIVNDGGDSRNGSWGDYDNDGDLDLFVTNEGASNFMYKNNGESHNFSFTKVTSGDIVSIATGGSNGMSWGDYDNDGHLDLFVGNLLANNFLLHNDGNDNSWINIRCIGTVSNSSAIGARVSVLATINGTSQWQIREISGGESSQNSLNAEFGLANATIIDTIRIRWPSGEIQVFTQVQVNQFLTIAEPQFVRITSGEIATDIGRTFGTSWGDFDNDGHPDLFVANGADENNFFYKNNGNGTFTPVLNGNIVSDGGNSQSATWGDYDNDRYLDLFVTNAGGQNNFLYHNNGDGTFTPVPTGPIVSDGGNSKGCSWGDYDNDGDLDLFVANDRETNFLYHNNGDGTFQKITTINIVTDPGDSFGANWIDYDNDGDVDLFVANIGNNFLYENNGNSTFTRITSGELVTSQGSLGTSWADFDNDGDLDVLLVSFSKIVLYRNEGLDPFSGQVRFKLFISQTMTGAPLGSSWADYDNDGDLDIFVAKAGDNFLWENNSGENFTVVTVGRIVNDGGNSTGAAWADYDGNGLLDLFVGNKNKNNFLYKTGGSGNHWLNIQLEGRASNSSAVGSKVSVTALIDGSLITQMREISAQTGYLSQNNLNTSFGLKNAEIVDSVKIEWPTGAVNKYTNIAANQFLVYEENNRPRAVNSVQIITLFAEGDELIRDILVSPVAFFDADDDALTFQVASSDSNIAAATLLGSQLKISLRSATAPGKAVITLTADDGRLDDGKGDTESMVFEVNRPPLLLRKISNKTFLPGNTIPFIEDLGSVFRDQDVGDDINFRIINPDSSRATTKTDDRILTITQGDSLGQVEITVEADDGRGGVATTNFTVKNIKSNADPELITGAPPDTILVLSGEPLKMNLKTLFADPNGDELNFSSSSSPPSIAFAGITDDTLLVVEPLGLGETIITVRANDGIGGEESTKFKVEVLLSFRPIITHTPVTQSQSIGQNIVIEAKVTDDEVAVTDAFMNYRVAGDASFDISPMELTNAGNDTFLISGSLPGTFVTNRGVEYFIIVQDQHGVKSKKDTISVRVRVAGDGLRNGSPQPGGDAQTSYRLISIPLDADDKGPESILEDDLGSYDPSQWRLFQWAALPDGGVVKGEYASHLETFDMSPGTALWLIVKDANKVIDSGPGVTVSTAEPFKKPVNSGWNLIGNPFNYPTIIANTLSNGSSLKLFSYEAGGWSEELDPNTTYLQPFAGFAVHAGSASNLLIKSNPFDITAALAKLQGTENEKPDWSLRILAQCQRARDSNNIVAVAQGASRDLDHWDSAEPPSVGEYVSVYFPHPEWEALSQRFSADVRPEPLDGDEWEFNIETNIRDVVTLIFKGIESVPSEYEVWLIDKALKITSNLRQRKNYSVVGGTGNNSKRLTLVVGKQSYVDEKLEEFQIVPLRYELTQNFPNPFNPTTTIKYSLPNSNRVTLKVFNLLGQEIVTLVHNKLKEAGYHVAIWNGRNAAGNVVTSGVYFYQLRAGDFFQVKKMSLLR